MGTHALAKAGQILARQIAPRAVLLWTLGLGLTIFVGSLWWPLFAPRAPLLLAPMMDLTQCLLAQSGEVQSGEPEWLAKCAGPKASSAHLVESTLRHLQPKPHDSTAWKLGYTLQVPLLALLQADKNAWEVNQQAISNIVQTVRDSPRPLVLYLFSTHFGINTAIEPILAQDADNLARTSKGVLSVDTYYNIPIYPWSVARTDNTITKYRVKVIQALLQELCTLPVQTRNRIQGITLLGEVHQLFPNFESGMGFGDPYQVSDYSLASILGFRHFLKERYASLQMLNQQIGSDYLSFEDIVPPAKNIRTETLHRYQDHIDAFAAGQIPITGWVHAPAKHKTAQAVKIYLDGKHIADAPVRLSRQDVRAAHPEFNTADLGWRYDLDFRHLPSGIHRIDLALFQPGQPLIRLSTRAISIMDHLQVTPATATIAELPVMQPLPASITAYTDEPRDQASYYYNPLAREWQAFREAQVVDYLQYFNTLVSQSCLADNARFTHQIVPQFNPSWDSEKYAVNASLRSTDTLHTGVSLYGETSYGNSLADWLKQNPHNDYGVTEFHPLQGMGSQQLGDTLSWHRQNGARFLSFFLETRWQGQRITSNSNVFSFDPDNRLSGSDQLYASMKTLLLKP